MTDWTGAGTLAVAVGYRSGMTDLIEQVRTFCVLGTADYTQAKFKAI